MNISVFARGNPKSGDGADEMMLLRYTSKQITRFTLYKRTYVYTCEDLSAGEIISFSWAPLIMKISTPVASSRVLDEQIFQKCL